jgi:hypothetical protein
MANSGMRLVLVGSAIGMAMSLTGLLAMTGVLKGMISPPLSAEIQLAEYPLPSGFGLEPQVVSDYLVEELTKRAQEDIALRLALGTGGQTKLVQIVIPRLVSSTVVHDMVRDIKPLANVLSVADFRKSAKVVVTNHGKDSAGVVLTIPGAVLVEGQEGTPAIETTSTGLTAVTMGDMASGESRHLTVWLGKTAGEGKTFSSQVLLGDAGGQSGRVWIYGQTSAWPGSDLEAMPLARWLMGGVLMLVFLLSGLTLIFAALSALPRRKVSHA